MPTDLDEMFAALLRDADAVPVAEAAAARRRGVHRTRMHATTAAAIAVVLVAAGLGGIAWSRRPGPPPASDTPLPTVGKRIAFGGTAVSALPQIENPMINPTRAYVLWSDAGGVTRVIATDLDDGHRLWQSPVAKGYDVTTMTVVSGAVVVIAAHGTSADGQMWVLDPNSGRVWRHGSYDLSAQHIFYPNALVTLDSKTGGLSVAAWDTGRVLWQQPPGSDPPVRISGSATLLDPTNSYTFRNYGTVDKPVDSKLIVVTRSGRVQVLDAGSGTGGAAATPQALFGADVNANGRQYAFGGKLVTVSESTPYQLQLTDLGDGVQASWTAPAGRTFVQLTPCGTTSVCVADAGVGGPELTLVDLGRQRLVWRIEAAGDVLDFRDTLVVTGGSDSMTAYDIRTGKKVASAPQLFWIDDTRLLELPAPAADGPVALVADDGTRTQLGTIPAQTHCAWTTSRLLCTDNTGIQIYALSR
jgi:hypothetical protein